MDLPEKVEETPLNASKEKSYKSVWIDKEEGGYFLDSKGDFAKGINKIGINSYYFTNDWRLKTNIKILKIN